MISYALVERFSKLCLFEELYRTYSQGMYQIALNIVHDSHHAEDMVSESFIRVAKNIHRISDLPPEKHRSYLKMIIRNICIDYYRHKDPADSSVEVPLDLSDTRSKPEDIVLDSLSITAISQAISQLPEKYCDVLKLCYLYDHTVEEISVVLNISPNTVYQRIYRAKKLLKDQLIKEGVLH